MSRVLEFFSYNVTEAHLDAVKLGVNKDRRLPVSDHSPATQASTGDVPSMPPLRLKVLHIEDNEADHALVAIHLHRGGIIADIRRIDTEAELSDALFEDWDLILCDYNLPGYSGLAALDKVRALGKLVPFILVGADAQVLLLTCTPGRYDGIVGAHARRLGDEPGGPTRVAG